MLTDRASGILLHPTSLPGAYGSGDFGINAYKFVDWLQSAGQSFWQILPLGEIGPGNSPYMSRSAFAGNILLIDLEELSSHDWLNSNDLSIHPSFQDDRINFEIVRPYRMKRLRLAARNFFDRGHDDMHRAFTEFCLAEKDWLEDYALFMTIAEQANWSEWNLWPKDLAKRDPKALNIFKLTHTTEIGFWKFCQWCFERQWSKLRLYASEHGVKIIGDVPIFVAYQSADVWAHQELFELDDNGCPSVVAGVPPDYFSETGQLWGNPLYRWNVHEETGYAWWIARIRQALQQTDLIRIDHFRGFVAYWKIPADAQTAITGKWEQGPGEKLFHAFSKSFPQLPFIAEDLGLITDDVLALRDKFQLPGMRVLQFAFGDGDSNHFLPHHYIPNTVAYTGTHDNDTTIGWWETAPDHIKEFAQHYLHCDEHHILQSMMKALSSSAANVVIFPIQDALGLSGEHRMNYPGKATGNWEWRFTLDQLHSKLTEDLYRNSFESGRTHTNNSSV